MSRYHVATDYERSKDRKRHAITVWSGAFCSDFEASGLSLPNHSGYMLTLYGGERLRVTCPCPRNEENYEEVDAAIKLAMTERLSKAAD